MTIEPAFNNDIFGDIPMGTGTWAWGDRLFWGYGRGYRDEDLRQVFSASVKNGVTFFDTAEAYGQGRSETLLGEFMKEIDQPIKIGSKFMPFPWRLSRRSLIKALKNSLKRLGREQVELYQIHQPLPPINVETWMEAMAEARQAGLIQGVGVSNYDQSQMQRAFDTLARQGATLTSNQVEYHLLNRKVEKNGLLKHCQEMGITLIAYSPLGLGLLTGKYTPDNPPGGARAAMTSRKFLGQIQPLLQLMRRIGAEHAGKTSAQVALNWVICKGAFPIPGAKTVTQIEQNLGALGWQLTEEEVAELDRMSDRVTEGK